MADTKTTEPYSGGDKPDNSGYAYSRKNTQPSNTKDPARRQGVLARPKTSKHRSPRAIRIRRRQQQTLELRLKGLAYEQIAKHVGISKSQVERDVIAAMAEMIREPVAAVFQMEMTRLDAMLAGFYEAARGGDHAAADTCLQIMRHRARLMGWGREEMGAKLLISDVNGPRALAIEFVLPSSARVADLENMMQQPSRHDHHHHDHHVYQTNKQIDAVVNKPVSVPIVPLPRKPTDW